MDPSVQQALADALAAQTKARSATISRCDLMSGGAIQQNWLIDIDFDGGTLEGPLAAVLRTNSDAVLAASLTRAQEFALFQTAFQAGVKVPEPLVFLDETNPLGKPLFLMRRVSGQAAGHKLVRAFPDGAPALCHELGVQLAKIHAIRPPQATLDFLGPAPRHPVQKWVAQMRRELDALNIARPVVELGLQWLERNAPEPGPVVLCHNDYRTGNYMLDGDHLSGILDWEFAGWGDPMQDIGWFTARCWRFGAENRAAGGIGPLDAFLKGYNAIQAITFDDRELAFWQGLATLRWAVIALAQGERHRSGVEPSLELALTNHIVPELEHDILNLIESTHYDLASL